MNVDELQIMHDSPGPSLGRASYVPIHDPGGSYLDFEYDAFADIDGFGPPDCDELKDEGYCGTPVERGVVNMDGGEIYCFDCVDILDYDEAILTWLRAAPAHVRATGIYVYDSIVIKELLDG